MSFAIAAIALVATYAFFYPYLPPVKRVHLFSDIEYYHYPLQQYAFQALKEGRFPQWDASMYCGIPFAGNIQAALFYPPSWILYAASWKYVRVPFKLLEGLAFLHVWWAFLLSYWWLRGRRFEVLASALGAGVFAYGGYMISQIVHLGVVMGLAWMPLALWGIDEAADRRTWHPLWKTVLASAMCFLAGYPPSWLVFCSTVLLYAWCSRWRWRAAAGVSIALAASMLLAAAQLLPALQARSFMVIDDKYGGGVHSWRALIPFFVPHWFDSATFYPDDTFYLYFGLATLFAIAWALRRHRWQPYAQPAIVGAVCLLLATNPALLIYKLMVHIPLLESMAQSYNFYEGVAAMAALFTATALNDFLQSSNAKPLPRWLLPAGCLMLLAWSVRQLWIAAHGAPFPTGLPALAQTALTLLLFSLCLWTFRGESGTRRTVAAAVLLLTAGIDYHVFGTNRHFNTVAGDYDQIQPKHGIHGLNEEAYQALFANRHYRIAGDTQGSPNVTDFRRWGLTTPQGFDPFLPRQYHDLIQRWVPFETNREFHLNLQNQDMLQSLAVRYVITHEGVGNEPRLAIDPNYRRIGQESFYRVYEYQHARPPYGWEDGRGTAQLAAWLPERRALQVASDSGGRFFLVEQFFPGWTATIDGRPTPIERWKSTFQSIQIVPGPHAVVFQYRTPNLALGITISLLALAGLVLVARADKMKRVLKP